MRNFFEARAGYDATVYAEAQALVDDGLDRDFVLGLFPDDAEWLSEYLEFSGAIGEAIAADQPSFYFEASLKNKFLAAADEANRVPEPEPVFAFNRMRTAAATMSVGLSAAAISLLALGFVTAGNAVPGDWNYSFKLANERLQYTLSRGDTRVDIQFNQAEARVKEIRVLSSRGDVSPSDIASLEREARALTELAKSQPLDTSQRARQLEITMQQVAVLNDIRQKQPALQPEVSAAAAAVNEAATTALSGPPTPVATPTATVAPSATPAATATPEPTASGTATPAPTTTPTPSPAPSATSTSTSTSETATPGASASPSATP